MEKIENAETQSATETTALPLREDAGNGVPAPGQETQDSLDVDAASAGDGVKGEV